MREILSFLEETWKRKLFLSRVYSLNWIPNKQDRSLVKRGIVLHPVVDVHARSLKSMDVVKNRSILQEESSKCQQESWSS